MCDSRDKLAWEQFEGTHTHRGVSASCPSLVGPLMDELSSHIQNENSWFGCLSMLLY